MQHQGPDRNIRIPEFNIRVWLDHYGTCVVYNTWVRVDGLHRSFEDFAWLGLSLHQFIFAFASQNYRQPPTRSQARSAFKSTGTTKVSIFYIST